jgi:small subunit ribosomal protein S8
MSKVTDPISDMLTRIRNANAAGHEEVRVPASRLKTEIARILKEEGYIAEYRVEPDGKQGVLSIRLRYGPKKQRILLGLRRVSKPGRRIYVRRDQIPRVQGGLGIAILSTSKGVMTDKQARAAGVGGEVICFVW